MTTRGTATWCYKEILLPEGAPDWMRDRSALWDAAEDGPTEHAAAYAQMARAIDAALPRGLAREEQIALARDFAAEAFVARGMAVDMAIHDAPASDGGRNVHVHYLLATREVTPEGFGGGGRGNGRGQRRCCPSGGWNGRLAGVRDGAAGVMEREAVPAMNGGRNAGGAAGDARGGRGDGQWSEARDEAADHWFSPGRRKSLGGGARLRAFSACAP